MVEKRVLHLLGRLNEVEEELGRPDIFDDPKIYRTLTQEHAYLNELRGVWNDLKRSQAQLKDNQVLLKEEQGPEFVQILQEDIYHLEERIHDLQLKLENLLVPPDPNDHRATMIELRAGTGGEEAALFVADCVRMYKLFADKKGWQYELLSSSPSDMGGFKEYVMVLSGPHVHRLMQYEGGTHRVQRIPATEAQGRVHTSAITIAIIAEPDETEEFNLDEKELRIDTYRASGAGGQHVNKTDSAVRITHLPTGTVVSCQEERSQHKNRDKAMRVLIAKLAEIEQQKKQQAVDSTRAMQVGSGDRSERIRTYNFPQNRLTDHRINLTKYNLDQIMEGDLEDICSALVTYFYQQKLKGSIES
jgi:peptide chain release factor 1